MSKNNKLTTLRGTRTLFENKLQKWEIFLELDFKKKKIK